MSKIQEIFNGVKQKRTERRKLRAAYKDALLSSKEYTSVVEELERLKARKKQIEETVREQFSSEFSQLDQLADDIKTDVQMMSDLALNDFMKGNLIEITDAYDNEYEPVFRVSFRKVS